MKKYIFLCILFLVLSTTAIFAAQNNYTFTKYKGKPVTYQKLGKGKQSLIFIHGWAGSSEIWEKQKELSDTYTCIFIDLPGNGKSQIPKKLSFTNYAKAIHQITRKEKISSVIIIAHSNGAFVAQTYNKLYSKQVKANIFLDGRLRSPFSTQADLEQFVTSLKNKTFTDQLFGFMANGNQEIQNKTKNIALETKEKILMDSIRLVGTAGNEPTETIKTQVFMLITDSPVWGEDYQKFVQTRAPKLAWENVGKISHFFMLEKPKETNQKIRIILTQLIK